MLHLGQCLADVWLVFMTWGQLSRAELVRHHPAAPERKFRVCDISFVSVGLEDKLLFVFLP